MLEYRGFIMNEPHDRAPWGKIEFDLLQKLIDVALDGVVNPTNHATLSNLQGGISSERYHLLLSEIEKLTGIEVGAQVNELPTTLEIGDLLEDIEVTYTFPAKEYSIDYDDVERVDFKIVGGQPGGVLSSVDFTWYDGKISNVFVDPQSFFISVPESEPVFDESFRLIEWIIKFKVKTTGSPHTSFRVAADATLCSNNGVFTYATIPSFTGELLTVDVGWRISYEHGNFTARDFTIHLVTTDTVDVNATIPDATSIEFQTRINKTSDIKTPDVIVATPSSQEIAGKVIQLIQSPSEGFFAVSHVDHYDIVQESRGGISRKLSQSTTIVSGYAIAQNVGDDTKIDVASGVFSEEIAGVTPVPPATSDLSNPTSKFVKTAALSAITITGLATDGYTILQVTPVGTVLQTLNDVPSQESENINPKIAVIVHAGGVILSAESWWTVGQNPSKRVSWLMGKLGILKEGVTVFGAVAGNLQFAHDTGILSYAGADGDKDPNNPDEQPVPSSDPVAGFILAKQDAFVNFAQVAIDPTQIDVGGTLTPLAGIDKVSVQKILINRNGSFTVQYGEKAYPTIQDGLTALSERSDPFTRFNVISKVSRICAYLIIDRTCTDLTDDSLRQFVQTGLLESDASLSSASELVTLLKALQNGNDAGGIQIKNMADPTLAQDASTKNYGDTTFLKKTTDTATGTHTFDQVAIGTQTPEAPLHVRGTSSFAGWGSVVAVIEASDGDTPALAFKGGATGYQWGVRTVGVGQMQFVKLTLDGSYLATPLILNPTGVFETVATIAEIDSIGNKALVTKEHVGSVTVNNDSAVDEVGTTSTIRGYKNGKTVTLNILVQNTTAVDKTSGTICTLDSEFFPPYATKKLVVSEDVTTNNVVLSISTAGVVSIFNGTYVGLDAYYATLTYLVL